MTTSPPLLNGASDGWEAEADPTSAHPPASASSARPFRPAAAELLASIAQHRVLSTRQAHALHTPDATIDWTRKLLTELRGAGVAASVRANRGEQLWYATPAGHDVLDAAPRADPRRMVIARDVVAGTLQQHTAALNDAGTAFVAAARRRGDDDECGPFDWTHEVAHPLDAAAAEGRRGGQQVIADAVLAYSRFSAEGDVELMSWFVELDRATMGLRAVVEKLRRYARMTAFVSTGSDRPAWRRLYPDGLPALALILAGGGQSQLERRRAAVLSLAGADAEIMQACAGPLSIRACVLADLTETGPWSPIWVDVTDPGRYVDAAGDPC